MRHDSKKIQVVESNIREAIREIFGSNSPEFQEHQDIEIQHGSWNINDDDEDLQYKFERGIPQSIIILEGLIERLAEKKIDLVNSDPGEPCPKGPITGARRVFVVHGHDEEAKASVARFLERLNLEPVVLSERPNEGRTIIEKFEYSAYVCYAVVLLSPDDIGSSRTEADAPRPRARQNVILELGYFIGRLSRSRVCALHKGTLELPSDVHGVIYVPMDASGGWKISLAKEMKAAGISIDMNLIF